MNRKGVTPVIATSLLIGIAVSTALTAAVFMEDTLSDVRGNFEDDISDQELSSKAEMSIDYGYERNGYMLLDIRNTGQVTLPLKDNDTEVLSVYIDGRPRDGWSFLSDREVLGTDGTITINTSESFPNQGNYKEVEITGAYDTESSIICYSGGGDSC